MNTYIFKISENEFGWIVEIKAFKYNLFGLHFCPVWKPFVKTSGLDFCWNHSSIQFAKLSLVDTIFCNNVKIKKLVK
jgi:hypothetical protein